MSTISDLVTYINAKSPGFEQNILGADPDEIAEIERLARRPLPSAYQEFLTMMGAFAAGYEPRRYSLDMFDVRRSLATDVRDYPSRYVKIGFDRSGREIPADLFFDYGSGLAQAEPIVVAFNDGGIFSPGGVLPRSWTLLDFLLEGAFVQYGVRELPYSDIYILFEECRDGSDTHAFLRAREILTNLGFREVFSSRHLYTGEQNEDTALLVSCPTEKSAALDISIADERRFKQMDSMFEELREDIRVCRRRQ